MNIVCIPDKTDKTILQDLEEAKKTAVEKVVMTVLYNYYYTGLSLRAGERGFSPATKRVAPGYFYWKIEENRTKRNP